MCINFDVLGCCYPSREASTVPAEPAGSLCQRISTVYARVIGFIIEALDACGCETAAMVIGTVLLEPLSALRTTCEWIYYAIKGQYDFAGVNPRELTEQQQQLHPVLCLHGNYHSPVAFTALGTAFANSYAPPVFTVGLNWGAYTDEDLVLVNEKVKEIQALYRFYGIYNVKIDLVGHSRGVGVAFRYCEQYDEREENIRRIVSLGRGSAVNHPSCFGIDGRLDRLAFTSEAADRAAQSALENPTDNYRLKEDLGHLELLYSADVHAATIGWLRS